MKTSEMSIIDTMVIIYAAFPNAPYHEVCRKLCDEALGGIRQDLCITPQVLVEFFATITNPKRVDPPRTSSQAKEEMRKYRDSLPLIVAPFDVIDHLLELLDTTSVAAQDIFDLQLAATALAAGVSHIITFDDKIFSRVPGLTVVRPG